MIEMVTERLKSMYPDYSTIAYEEDGNLVIELYDGNPLFDGPEIGTEVFHQDVELPEVINTVESLVERYEVKA